MNLFVENFKEYYSLHRNKINMCIIFFITCIIFVIVFIAFYLSNREETNVITYDSINKEEK